MESDGLDSMALQFLIPVLPVVYPQLHVTKSLPVFSPTSISWLWPIVVLETTYPCTASNLACLNFLNLSRLCSCPDLALTFCSLTLAARALRTTESFLPGALPWLEQKQPDWPCSLSACALPPCHLLSIPIQFTLSNWVASQYTAGRGQNPRVFLK